VSIRNVCRCGTYVRIRSAIKDGATKMSRVDFRRCGLTVVTSDNMLVDVR
jgi:hypothetical protein